MSNRLTERTREEMQRLVNAFPLDTEEDISQDLYCLAEDVARVVLEQFYPILEALDDLIANEPVPYSDRIAKLYGLRQRQPR